MITSNPYENPSEPLSYQKLAVQMLTGRPSIYPLSTTEAWALVNNMHPYVIPAGECFIVEDERNLNEFMMLILSGEVLIESKISDGQILTLSVLKPGQWIGELGLLDGGARQATCSAAEGQDVTCAILNKNELLMLLEKHPQLASKLILLLASNTAQSLRELHQKICRYAEIHSVIRDSSL